MIFNGRVNLEPYICFDIINLNGIIILSIRVNPTKFYKKVLAYGRKAGISCSIFTRRNGLHLFCFGIEHLTFFQCFIVVSHSSSDENEAIMIDDRVAWASNRQLCDFHKGFAWSIIPIYISTSFKGVHIGASNEIDDSSRSCYCSMEGRNGHVCIQLLDLPANRLVQFYLINSNCVQSLVANLEEMKEWLRLEVILCIYSEGLK